MTQHSLRVCNVVTGKLYSYAVCIYKQEVVNFSTEQN
uniref:Uncharacterized protein n=1 Tax=Arundo donax TaxID=35708 RepID=A0A0A9CAQ0_ARUDO